MPKTSLISIYYIPTYLLSSIKLLLFGYFVQFFLVNFLFFCLKKGLQMNYSQCESFFSSLESQIEGEVKTVKRIHTYKVELKSWNINSQFLKSKLNELYDRNNLDRNSQENAKILMSNVYIYSKNHYSYHLQLGSSDILAPIPKMLHFHPFKKIYKKKQSPHAPP